MKTIHHLRNQHRLIIVLDQHVLVGGVNDSEDVRGHFRGSFTTVHLDNFISVDGKTHVGVDSDTKQTGVGLKGVKKENLRL